MLVISQGLRTMPLRGNGAGRQMIVRHPRARRPAVNHDPISRAGMPGKGQRMIDLSLRYYPALFVLDWDFRNRLRCA